MITKDSEELNANSAVLKIELSGRRPNGSRLAASGLTIQASPCLVKGLAINRFGQHGVVIKSASTTVEGNFIGTDPGGTIDRGNGADGVRIESAGNLIGVRRTRRRTLSPVMTITACSSMARTPRPQATSSPTTT